MSRKIPPIPPIRSKPVPGVKKARQFERACAVCDASFLELASDMTGERGTWGGPTGWKWFCSLECSLYVPPEMRP